MCDVLTGEVAALVNDQATSRGSPAGGEQRLRQFTDLAAATLAYGRAHVHVTQLVNQQTALRKVTELAARDPNSGDGVTQRVWRTHRSARIDQLTSVPSEWSDVALGLGFTTSAAVPILIRGGLWGTLVVIGRGEPLTEAIEDSLNSFADLAGTAISNAQARQDLRALADEQAAFRRVAELVAHGTALDRVFCRVTGEASKLLGGLVTALQCCNPDGSTTTVAAHTPLAATLSEETTEVAVPVTVEGRMWGFLTTRSPGAVLSGETEDRLRQFAELTAVAIANAENKAKLTESRARVVATADETRRRLQRDVHDGAQQRLVHTIITLKLALNDAAADGTVSGAQVAEALQQAERANSELRDLVHGILPAALTRGGLRSGLESLISDMSIPIQLHLTAPPLPPDVETTIYFVVAEALTNVVKHARATRADVSVDDDDGRLSIEVSDDGVGGADPAAGVGLIGLADRIEAVSGSLAVTSAVGNGTTLRASFPFRCRAADAVGEDEDGNAVAKR